MTVLLCMFSIGVEWHEPVDSDVVQWAAMVEPVQLMMRESSIVVISPESFACPPCEVLKRRLTNAGVKFVVRRDDSLGPWPRIFLGNVEVKLVDSSEPSQSVTQVAVTDESHHEPIHSMESHGESAHMGRSRVGPLRRIGRLFFGRRSQRERSRVRYSEPMHSSSSGHS